MNGPGTEARAPASRGEAWAGFIARITAGATHELRNMLAITKESAGLIGDLTAAGSPAEEKVTWALDRIRLQVTRGTELTDALNRVMHGLDSPTQVVDLNQAIEYAALIARRAARRNRCEVDTRTGVEATVKVNALDLYMALVEITERCAAVAEDGEVTLQPELDGTQPAIHFTVNPGLEGLGEDDWARLEDAADVLGGGIERSGDSVFLRLEGRGPTEGTG